MTEHPILFSAPMVRAILEGRKTVTRRVPSARYLSWKKGELIWVKESWQLCGEDTSNGDPHTEWVYRADNEKCSYCGATIKWKSPLFMPRYASRLTLRLTDDVYEEPLQNITEEDAKAEGIIGVRVGWDCLMYKPAYSRLWDSINAKRGYPWASFPNVAVIRFEVVK